MSEHGDDPVPEVYHLVSAHETVWTWRAKPTYVAMCGAWVDTTSLMETACPNACPHELGELASCPDCLRAAIGQNRRAGVDAGDGSMATARG